MSGSSPPLLPFSDPESVARYAEGSVRQVPGFHGLQRMISLLLAERTPDDAQVLVLCTGGGLDLKAFADTQPEWRFCGVDPSAEMLGLARRTLGPLASRVEFHVGYIDSAPVGPFGAATCLLTLHFIPGDERRRTLAEVHQRLLPGAPSVVAHHSFPQDGGEKAKWLARYAAFAVTSGAPAEKMGNAIATISKRLPVLSPEQDEALLRMSDLPTSPCSTQVSRSEGGVPTKRDRQGVLLLGH